MVEALATRLTVLVACGFLLAGGCGRGSQWSHPPVQSRPAISSFAFDASIKQFAVGEFDSFLVVAVVRNVSKEPIQLCALIDFEGHFSSRQGCPGGGRQPTFYLLPRAGFLTEGQEDVFDCREVLLAPGEAFADSTHFQLYRPEFEICPGDIEVRGSLWSGQPGDTFAEATLLALDVIRESISVP